jgi:hypothetical protein
VSQIAHAYLVKSDVLAKLSELAKKGDYASFWQSLKSEGCVVEPAYSYSGSVVTVLLAFLAENDIDIPLNVSDSNLAELSRSCDLGLMVAADSSDAAQCLAVLDCQTAEERSLGRYFDDFTHNAWDESGKAMMEAFQFVRNGLNAVKDYPGYYLLFAG